MPRHLRCYPPDVPLHVLNRGNDRRRLFESAGDYSRFSALLFDEVRRREVRLLGYVLMPNHWHLVVWPRDQLQLTRFLQRLTGRHAAAIRTVTATVGHGHVYQGRYRAFVLESPMRLIRTVRYVEANPLRAALVTRAEDWQWSSLRARLDGSGAISRAPIPLPPNSEWLQLVNQPTSAEDARVASSAPR